MDQIINQREMPDELILENRRYRGRKKKSKKLKRGPKLNMQELEDLGNPLDSIERRQQEFGDL